MADNDFAVVEWQGSAFETVLVGLYSVSRKGVVSDANFATYEEAVVFMDEWEAIADEEDEKAAERKARNDGPWEEVDTP